MAKILLVEDDKSLREIYGVRLLAEGYDIISAGDGEEALAMAIKDRPNLVISDVMMPKISGYDMLDILRSTTETRDIKVIMMTALSSEDQRQRGVALGADRYLVKSQVGIEDVVRTVHEILGDAPAGAQSTEPAPQVAPQPAPAPQPIAPTVATAQPYTQPTPAPTPVQPQPVAQPVAPAPAATPQLSAPPQPSSPTPRTPTLGDRVIQPLSTPTETPDFAHMMNQELGQGQIGQGQIAQESPAPQVAVESQLQAPTAPQPIAPPSPDLRFEETPRNNSLDLPPIPPRPPVSPQA